MERQSFAHRGLIGDLFVFFSHSARTANLQPVLVRSEDGKPVWIIRFPTAGCCPMPETLRIRQVAARCRACRPPC